MGQCYAACLGDCEGPLEREHFYSASLQRLLGKVVIKGMAWQQGTAHELPAETYAVSRILCAKHHDELDGTDEAALAYFSNFMLIAAGGHTGTGHPGSSRDIKKTIDGRQLERWFLKYICGGIASGAIPLPNPQNVDPLPEHWIRALFGRDPWPDELALYLELGEYKWDRHEATFRFFWGAIDGLLHGISIQKFALNTVFSIIDPIRVPQNMWRRPTKIGASVSRPNKGPVLEDLEASNDITFELVWPETSA